MSADQNEVEINVEKEESKKIEYKRREPMNFVEKVDFSMFDGRIRKLKKEFPPAKIVQEDGTEYDRYFAYSSDAWFLYGFLEEEDGKRLAGDDYHPVMIEMPKKNKEEETKLKCLACIWIMNYHESTCGPYNEVVFTLTVAKKETIIPWVNEASFFNVLGMDSVYTLALELFLGPTVSQEASDLAVEFGRKVHGFPKFSGEVDITQENGFNEVTVMHNGKEIIKIRSKKVVPGAGTMWSGTSLLRKALGFGKLWTMLRNPTRAPALSPKESETNPGEVVTDGYIVTGGTYFHKFDDSDSFVLAKETGLIVSTYATSFTPFVSATCLCGFPMMDNDPRVKIPKKML